MVKKDTRKFKIEKVIPWILIITGVVGLLMSAVLIYDETQISHNPNYKPSCNLNPVVSCGSVIVSKQAQAFHFSNPYIGLVGFAVIVTTGVTILAGAKLKRWYWLGLEGGAIFGVAFCHWLFYQSVYRIHDLCPFCAITWIAVITLFWYTTYYNFWIGNLTLPEKLKPAGKFVTRHHIDILVLWFLIIAALILNHFWYYYGKFL
jgi:uncharacterized membrane protein